MKIAFISIHYPCPPNYGAAKRVYHICKILGSLGELSIFVLKNEGRMEPDRLDKSLLEFDKIDTLTAYKKSKGISPKLSLFLNYKNIRGRNSCISVGSENQLKKKLKKYDVVWCHTLEAADRTGVRDFGCNSVLDFDDLISDKFRYRSRLRENRFKLKFYWRLILWRLWEKDAFKRFSDIAVCSKKDAKIIGYDKKTHVLSNGFEPLFKTPEFKLTADSILGFVGYLDYLPNLEGVNWFITYVLPALKQVVPRIRVRVVGNISHVEAICQDDAVDVLGFVEKLDEEMQGWDGMIVPLWVGGGTRIKILEAFSKRIPVVSTSVGAHGLDVKHGKHLYLSDTADDFSKNCFNVISYRSDANNLTIEAYNLFINNYTWDHVKHKIINLLHREPQRIVHQQP